MPHFIHRWSFEAYHVLAREVHKLDGPTFWVLAAGLVVLMFWSVGHVGNVDRPGYRGRS